MAEKLIVGGAWVQVLVMIDRKLKSIGLANSCSYDEDWNIVQGLVLNHLGPISLDSQGYTCTMNMGSFVPEKTITLYADGGEITINDILPSRDEVQRDGKGRGFDQLVFLNTATQKVEDSFSGVVIASNGKQISPNAYVTANIRFMAIKRDKNPIAA